MDLSRRCVLPRKCRRTDCRRRQMSHETMGTRTRKEKIGDDKRSLRVIVPRGLFWGALITSDPNPSDFQFVVLVVAFALAAGARSDVVVCSSYLRQRRGGKRVGGRQTPKQAATTAKAACEEKREGGSLTYLSCLCPPFPPPPFKEDEGERRRFLFPSSKKSFMG